MIERHYEEDRERSKEFNSRLKYLLPYNFGVLLLTVKYAQNLNRVASRFWPNRQKATFRNMVLVGTFQSILFTTLYVSGGLLVLRINLKEIYIAHHKQKKEEMDLLARTKINLDGSID